MLLSNLAYIAHFPSIFAESKKGSDKKSIKQTSEMGSENIVDTYKKELDLYGNLEVQYSDWDEASEYYYNKFEAYTSWRHK